MATDDNLGAAIVGFSYIFAAIVCSAISAFSTYAGFRVFPPIVAIFISMLIFLLLLACDVSILRARTSGGRLIRTPRTLLGPVLMLMIVTVISTSSSFTFFYSLTMRDRLASARAAAAGEAFENNYATALNALRSLSSATSKEHDIELQLANLETQVLNSGRLGFGSEAQSIIHDISETMGSLGAPITPMAFPNPPGTPALNKIALDRFTTAVQKNIIAAKSGDGISPTIDRINAIHENIEPVVREARDDSTNEKFEQRVRAIVKIQSATADIERETNQVLAQKGHGVVAPVRLKAENIVGIRLYTAPEVYSVAFTVKEGFPYAIGSFIFAAALDLFPLLLAILLIQPATEVGGVIGLRSSRPLPDIKITGSHRW